MVYFVSGHELAVHQHGEELMDGAGQDAAVAHDPRTEGEEMAVTITLECDVCRRKLHPRTSHKGNVRNSRIGSAPTPV